MSDRDAALAGQPELVRVGRRDGWRPVAVGLVVAVSLLGLAVWKPWDAAPGAGPVTRPPSAAGEPLPATASTPATTDSQVATPRSAASLLAGLDLSMMGTSDPHAAWGVAVAHVSRLHFDNASRRGAPTVTPLVTWELMRPGSPGPGPILDHPNVTSVAVAATWPADVRTRAIRLWVLGPPRNMPSGLSVPIPTAAVRVELGRPLAAIVSPPGAGLGAGRNSGAFFLVSSTLPDGPAAWRGNGWPSGSYVFDIELEGGGHATLPFQIGGVIEP